MSTEVARSSASSSRGRGGGRGGRGGFGGRSANPRRPNGDNFDDDDDVSQLRKQHGDKLDTVKDIFPDWSDADILYALAEADGDLELVITRISEGSVSQWDEVAKPKKSSSKPKTPGPSNTIATADVGSRPARGGRVDSGRGGRGRGAGADRARGSAGRGRAGAQAVTANGHSKENQPLSVPTDEASAWDNAATATDATPSTDSWANAAAGAPVAAKPPNNAAPKQVKAAAPEAAAPKPAAPAVKTWASMLRQSSVPPPKPAAPKPKEAPEAPKPDEVATPVPTTESATPEPVSEPTAEPEPVVEQPEPIEEPKVVEAEVALPPPEDNLTKVNLELLPDESKPVATATVASTTADSWDPRQPAVATPLSASQAQHQNNRGPPSGYAASALKATERPTPRMPSYQRRLLEQEEAVRMPGNREVDRTAVQFGAFNLGDSEEDVDGDREEPETRTQPPQESPAAPRAALPPVTQQAQDSFPTSQKAPGAASTPVAAPTGPVGSASQTPQAPSSNQPFRQGFPTQEPAGFSQKPYDSFAQQNPVTTSAGFDSFPAPTSQAPGPQGGAFSSAPNDYSAYYSAEQQGRNAAYNNYYGHYGQQGAQTQHDGPGSHSRAFGGYGAGQAENISQYPQSGAQQSRFGAAASVDSQNSGHNTPNPTTQSQQQSGAQASQPQSNVHQQPHGSQYGGYQQHPYYTSPYYQQYMNQAFSGYGQGYGGGPYGKAGGYGQPHQYGMNPQGPYDHSSSPATSGFGGQSSITRNDSGLSSSVDNFGRAGSSQSGAQGGFGGNSGFGGAHDSFSRGSGYPQSGQGFNAPSGQGSSAAAGTDDLKPYGVESKTGAGPSPSLSGAARPGSATNTPGAPGLPPAQSSQQGGAGGYGGYPGHLQSHGLHGAQGGNSAYGLSGSGNQGQGNNPYGGAYGGSQGFGNYYGGRQQHQGGGWGGNYH